MSVRVRVELWRDGQLVGATELSCDQRTLRRPLEAKGGDIVYLVVEEPREVARLPFDATVRRLSK